MDSIKRAVLVLAVITAVFGMSACKRAKQIPNDTLSDIFKDMYVLNAYMDRTRLVTALDSTDVYSPILEKYGYTDADFKYTITEATKRKSFKLADVLQSAIDKLDAEYSSIQNRVKRQDMIDSMAYAMSGQEIYRDSVINIRKVSDTASIRIPVPMKQRRGRFDIAYYYTIDSADVKMGEQTNRHELRNARGKVRQSSSVRMFPGTRTKYQGFLEATPGASELRLKFGNYTGAPGRLNLTIDSLVVVHQLPREEALKAFVGKYAGYKLMIDGKEYDEYFKLQTDSSTLHIIPPFAPQQSDSLDRR